MAEYNTKLMTTINHVKLGTWTQITCPALTPPPAGDLPVGECDINIVGAQVSYGGLCYECVGGLATKEMTQLKDNADQLMWAKIALTYNVDGGSAVGTQYVYWESTYGTAVARALTNKGYYSMNGWYTAASGGTEIVAATEVTVTTAQTIYARWQKNPVAVSNLEFAGAGYYSLSFDFENSNPYEVRLYYGTDASPRTNYITVAANSYDYINITGLTPNTSYKYYFCYYADVYTTTINSTNSTEALPTYRMQYAANYIGGTDPAEETKTQDIAIAIRAAISRTGYNFSTWNTTPSVGGTNYAPGYSYTTNANLYLYARWDIITYTVSYNVNGSGGTGAPSSQTKTYGVTLTLSSTTPTRAGYAFNGWNTNSSGTGTNYAAGGSYTANAAVTLYAKWILETKTWTLQSGTPTPNLSITHADELPICRKESQTKIWLIANYPAANYSTGYIVRVTVRRGAFPGTVCATRYYKVTV